MSRFLAKKKDMIYNKKTGEKVGRIYFFKGWKKYVFEPRPGFIYDKMCLEDIMKWLGEENEI